jgi:putative transposase
LHQLQGLQRRAARRPANPILFVVTSIAGLAAVARLRRYQPVQLSHHVVQRGNNRSDVFRDAWDYEIFLLYLAEASSEHGVAIHNYVLMTNHVHLIATPSTSKGLPKLMQAVGRRYVPYFNRRHARTGGLWEGRYRSFVIESESYLLRCMRYVELNPVRARVVEHPRDYEWSSYHANACGDEDAVVRVHPYLEQWQPDVAVRRAQYSALCDQGLAERELAALRKAAHDGVAVGSPQFVSDIRQRVRGQCMVRV